MSNQIPARQRDSLVFWFIKRPHGVGVCMAMHARVSASTHGRRHISRSSGPLGAMTSQRLIQKYQKVGHVGSQPYVHRLLLLASHSSYVHGYQAIFLMSEINTSTNTISKLHLICLLILISERYTCL